MAKEEVTLQNCKALRQLYLTVEKLQEQMSCGCEGHIFVVWKEAEKDASGKVINWGFRCIRCDVMYYKYLHEMTEKEQEMTG